MVSPYIIAAVFGAIHLGYVLTAFVYPKKKKKKSTDIQPSVEHIVCFKNEANFIEQKLKNCYSIDYPYIHYTFVNDNSTDNTLELLNRYKRTNTHIFTNKNNLGKNQSQMKAVEKTSSDLLLFTDANVFLERDSVKQIVSFFDESTGGICGNVTITTDMKHKRMSGRYWEIEKTVKSFQSLFGSVIGFDGGFYCVRRKYYNLKRENELSDFETAFLLFVQQKQTVYAKDAVAIELEKRRIKASFMARLRASNRTLWSFVRIFKYINKLNLCEIIHFTLYKLIRYLFVIAFIFSLPFLIIDYVRISPFLVLIFLIPQVWRFIVEGIALCMGGIIALTGKEYTVWSNKKT